MHTETDFIKPVTLALQDITKFEEDLLGVQPSIKCRDIIDYFNRYPQKLGFLLDSADQSPLASSPSEPRVNRTIRNLNSHGQLRKRGIVNNVDNGMMLTEYGRSLTEDELDGIIQNIKWCGNYAIDDKLYGYHNVPEPSIKTSTKKVKHYNDSKKVKTSTRSRSGGKCEACLEPFFLNKSGIPYCHEHHIFDKHSKDSNMPSKRYDHIDFVTAICGNCHDYLHHGKLGCELNGILLTKIQEHNKLNDNLAPEEDIVAIMHQKII